MEIVQFIICGNDEMELQECQFYLNRLKVPDGWKMEITVVRNAVSMTAGYQSGMEQMPARYRVYLHQDTMIINQNFIEDFSRIFRQNEKVGIIGMIGTDEMPADGIFYDKWNVGWVVTSAGSLEIKRQEDWGEWERSGWDTEYLNATAVDGLLLITQYDIPWRVDLFDDWDYYDISQCMEFVRAGYEVVVPYQKEPWCWHDNETSKLGNLERNRRIFQREYQKDSPYLQQEVYHFNQELELTLQDFAGEIKRLVNAGKIGEATILLKQYHAMIASSAELCMLENLSFIEQLEAQGGIRENDRYCAGQPAEERMDQMRQDKYQLKRIENGDQTAIETITERMELGKLSKLALQALCACYVKDKEIVYKQLRIV